MPRVACSVVCALRALLTDDLLIFISASARKFVVSRAWSCVVRRIPSGILNYNFSRVASHNCVDALRSLLTPCSEPRNASRNMRTHVMLETPPVPPKKNKTVALVCRVVSFRRGLLRYVLLMACALILARFTKLCLFIANLQRSSESREIVS